MYNITLISTLHSECGKSNSDELCKIIESICPEVVFEELPKTIFDIAYSRQFHGEPLEIRSIKKYLQNHSIKHVPVDIEASQYLFDSEIDYMDTKFIENPAYSTIVIEQTQFTENEGFSYLNSKKSSELFAKKEVIQKNIVEFDNDSLLARIYYLYNEHLNNRENAMIENIYNYSEENRYNKAVFLLGAGHRTSIVKKIAEYETKENLKLNWTFYGNPWI